MLGLAILNLALLLCCSAAAEGGHASQAVRWSQGAANCTLQDGADGRTYYGISLADLQVVLAVDSQELEKVRHRATPMLSVLLSFEYREGPPIAVAPDKFYLEFVKHFHVKKSSLNPDEILHHLQQNAADLTDEVERHQIRKHPEQKGKEETELQARLKDYTEMMDFVSTHALHSTMLKSMNSSAAGWVFFPIKDRWIGPWQRPEQFILRIPVQNRTIEFPFSLPPQQGRLELRQRQSN